MDILLEGVAELLNAGVQRAKGASDIFPPKCASRSKHRTRGKDASRSNRVTQITPNRQPTTLSSVVFQVYCIITLFRSMPLAPAPIKIATSAGSVFFRRV